MPKGQQELLLMIDFIFFYLQAIHFSRAQNVLQNQGLFSSIVRSYNMMRTFSIYVLFPLILIGWGIKEFALFIYPYGWVLIFSDILLICFGERLKQFFTGIFWKNFRVQNFLRIIKKVLDGFVETVFNRYPLEMGYLTILQEFQWIWNKLCWS